MEIFDKRVGLGFVLGFGTALILSTAGTGLGRTLFKSAIKGMMLAAERVRELGAHLREAAEDAAAEVQAELHNGHASNGDARRPPAMEHNG